jgi:hypothetical protein
VSSARRGGGRGIARSLDLPQAARRGDDQDVLISEEPCMNSTLVVFYSYSGTCRRAAQLLASHYGWPLAEIRDARPRAGSMGDLRCVLDSLLQRRPAIRYEGAAPADFDTVVIVSYMDASRVASEFLKF